MTEYKELHEYRVKPARNYGTRRNVILSWTDLDNNLLPRDDSRLQMTYDDKVIVCYNPQNLSFNLNKVISALQTIHGKAEKIEVIK